MLQYLFYTIDYYYYCREPSRGRNYCSSGYLILSRNSSLSQSLYYMSWSNSSESSIQVTVPDTTTAVYMADSTLFLRIINSLDLQLYLVYAKSIASALPYPHYTKTNSLTPTSIKHTSQWPEKKGAIIQRELHSLLERCAWMFATDC